MLENSYIKLAKPSFIAFAVKMFPVYYAIDFSNVNTSSKKLSCNVGLLDLLTISMCNMN